MLFPADYVAFDLGPTIEYGGHYLIAGYNVGVGYYPTVTINEEAGSGTVRREYLNYGGGNIRDQLT